MTPDDFFSFAKKHDAGMVDLKFVDMLGSWQHCSFPIDHLDTDTFKDGLGFDGSSIRLVSRDATRCWAATIFC